MSNKSFTAEQVKVIMQMHEESILKFIKMNFELVTTRIDMLAKDVQDMKTSLNFTGKDNHEKITKLQEQLKEVKTEVKTSVANLAEMHVRNTTDLQLDKEKINDLENWSRRNNIRVDGIQENKDKTWEETERKLKIIIKEELKIQKDIVIERAHRTGEFKENRHRTIIAKVLNYKDKNLMLEQAKNMKLLKKHIYINEDFSAITMKQRKEMAETVKQMRENGDFAVIRYNKLITTQPKNWINHKKNLNNGEGIIMQTHD